MYVFMYVCNMCEVNVVVILSLIVKKKKKITDTLQFFICFR